MVYCPFQPPNEGTLTYRGRSLPVRRFDQNQGFSFTSIQYPIELPSGFDTWSLDSHSAMGFVQSGRLTFSRPDHGQTRVNEGEWFLWAKSSWTVNYQPDPGTRLVLLECEEVIWNSLLEGGTTEHNHQACICCQHREETLFFKSVFTTRMHTLVRDLVRLDGRTTVERLSISSRSYELLSEALASPMLCKRPSADPCLKGHEQEALDKAAQFLENNLDHDHSIQKLSRYVYLNECKLKKAFRARFQTTIFGYLREKRMQRAHELLLGGDRSVLEVANAVGYANPSHFSRAFRSTYGVNPRQMKHPGR